MSTGMDAAVVTNPENMEAKKWQNMPSFTYPEKERTDVFYNCIKMHNDIEIAFTVIAS